MRHIIRGCVVLAALSSANAMAEASIHLAATAGLSFGGDTLATVYYTNGDSEELTAGGLFYLGIGPSIEFKDSPLSVQMLIGHHADSVNADGGELEFSRNTLDTQVFYRAGDHRFGAGLVNHFNAEYQQTGFYSPSITGDFKNATGVSLEYNWMPVGSHFGVSVRGVKIDYELESLNHVPVSGFEAAGDHLAVGLYAYF
jgi:hypothetical protein